MLASPTERFSKLSDELNLLRYFAVVVVAVKKLRFCKQHQCEWVMSAVQYVNLFRLRFKVWLFQERGEVPFVIIRYQVTEQNRYIEAFTCSCPLSKEKSLAGLKFVTYSCVDISITDYDFSFLQTSFPIVCM